jgi:hypothetical protein
MKVLIILGLIAAASAVSFIEVSRDEWTMFKVSYNSFLPAKIFVDSFSTKNPK